MKLMTALTGFAIMIIPSLIVANIFSTASMSFILTHLSTAMLIPIFSFIVGLIVLFMGLKN